MHKDQFRRTCLSVLGTNMFINFLKDFPDCNEDEQAVPIDIFWPDNYTCIDCPTDSYCDGTDKSYNCYKGTSLDNNACNECQAGSSCDGVKQCSRCNNMFCQNCVYASSESGVVCSLCIS